MDGLQIGKMPNFTYYLNIQFPKTKSNIQNFKLTYIKEKKTHYFYGEFDKFFKNCKEKK
jgi:hypothetical protein